VKLLYDINVSTFGIKNKIKLLKAQTFIKNYAYKHIYEKQGFVIGDLHQKQTQRASCAQKGKKRKNAMKFFNYYQVH
jgi:hypothetical protein